MTSELTKTQTSYIFAPAGTSEPAHPAPKRRKLAKSKSVAQTDIEVEAVKFGALFNGAESADCVGLRYELYQESWEKIEGQIHVGVATMSPWPS